LSESPSRINVLLIRRRKVLPSSLLEVVVIQRENRRVIESFGERIERSMRERIKRSIRERTE